MAGTQTIGSGIGVLSRGNNLGGIMIVLNPIHFVPIIQGAE